MDDEQLLALKKNGGVIQIVGFSTYLRADSKERVAALAKLREEFGLPTPGRAGTTSSPGADGEAAGAVRTCPVEGMPGISEASGAARGRGRENAGLDTLSRARRAEYQKRLSGLDATYPPAGRANVQDLVNHIDYAVKLMGIDHVGISSDFDGGGGIDGWNSAAEAFNVTLELVRRGYTEEQIGKLWSGNLLRVWGEVQKVAQQLKKEGTR